MSFQIAPLKLSEYPRWLELWSEYQRFYRVELPANVTENTWQRILDGRLHGLGARDAGDQLLGIVHFLYHQDTWSIAPACYLQDLYVDPSTRGTGCGRRLIEAVAVAAHTTGANPPYWLTHETNAAARRLYDRVGKNLGFIQYSYSPPESRDPA